jgi:acyl transferase domain-containing protein/thioesterase domain-containing protein
MSTVPQDLEGGSIAIVGMAGRFPAASNTSELWSMLREGREATQWLSEDELRAAGVPESDIADPDYVRASLVLPEMEMFDAGFFGFSKRDASVLDPQHRHFLECAWEALEDAGHMPENFAGAIGVFGGCGMQAYLPYNLLTNPQLVKSMGLFLLRHTGNDKDFLCSRVSYALDLKGPSVSIQTACSTSLVAVHIAAQSLLAGECDMALAGGASIELPHRQGYVYAAGEILSPDGHCRAFDEDAGGTIFGSGAGIVVLRRLEDAVRDGDNIHAVIRGSAVNNDGSRKAGYLAPSVDGQARAAVEALAVSGVDPASVSYIEAHGTGTPVGDPIEIAALTQAYGGDHAGRCGIGSLKTNIGHLDTAAGVASLIKVSLALRHGLIPASLNFSEPNSRFDMARTPFHVVDKPTPWPRTAAPRRAAVNALGVGGTNAHVIVEEPPANNAQALAPTGEASWQVFTLSARTTTSLERLKQKWLRHLEQPSPDFNLPDAAFTTQVGRRAFEHRCAVVARNIDGLRESLQARHPLRSADGKSSGSTPPVVMMFPGGGAHYPGAGRELLAHPAFAQAIDQCFTALPPDAPRDLRRVMFDAGANDEAACALLARPTYGLPALFILEYAIARLWERWGVRPDAMIGHSAGDYAAACLAGVMPLADALCIVLLRGQLFESAPAGGMLSVDLPEAELRSLMQGIDIDIAAVNAADLCMASGPVASIAVLEQRLAQRKLEGRRLRIDVAAHSHLLDGVLDAFHRRVSRIRLSPPTVRLMSNVTGDWADPHDIATADYWVKHLRQPVRFADGIRRVLDMPGVVLLEVGPGQGLCALARQNSGGTQRTIVASTCKPQEAGADLATMLTAAGALWTRGITPDWKELRGPGERRRISLPTYAFDHERHWIEPGIVVREEPMPAREPQAAALARIAARDDWFRAPEWVTADLPQVPQSQASSWLVFANPSVLAGRIASAIAAIGGAVTTVRSGRDFTPEQDGAFTIDACNAQHYRRLFTTLADDGRAPSHIVHLWALDAEPGARALPRAQTLAFDSLLEIARSLQEQDSEDAVRLTVIASGSQAVKGEAVRNAQHALALGACRVIPREMPQVTARFVDIDFSGVSADDAASRIVREAQAQDGLDLVAWRGSMRWRQQLSKAAPNAKNARQRLRRQGVYLITGGFGDIAMELAATLASECEARLVLVGRHVPRPDRWRALEDKGAQVLALQADVTSRDEMAQAVAQCRSRFGALHGVFHTAGVLDDGLIATKTPESIARVLRPKVLGAQVLHELLPAGELDIFAVFSSSSVHLGGAGQADYVAANAYLDALAASRPDGLAIQWGVWSGLGMAARAYGQTMPPPAADAHPLLGTRVDAEIGAIFEQTYDAAAMWVLREHLVGGRPVLPGTAYIEIARAAMAQLHPSRAVEIRSLSFEEAMVFDAASKRRVRIELRPDGESYDFVVRSRGAGDDRWHEHARAHVGTFDAQISSPALPAITDWREGSIPQAHAVNFGERWHNIAKMRLGERGADAQIELPDAFHDDLAVFEAHPALLDMAATFGLHLIDARQRQGKLFVPLSIERIRLAAALPARLMSHVAYRHDADDFAAFDVSLCTPQGSPIASLEGFSLRAVAPELVAEAARAPKARPGLAQQLLECGIRREDAQALFARILSAPERCLLVSSIELDDIRRVMAAPAPKAAPRAESRAVQNPEADNLNAVESTIAEAWRELLGVEAVAKDDDFFALGGHSLAAVRLFARIRKHFNVDLPLATLFQAATLAGLAAVVAQAAGVDTARPAPTAKATSKPASNVIPLHKRAWSPLVPICRGRADRRPLFCVHGAGGNVLNFRIISDRLGSDQPFYGLQAQGVDGRLQPLATIEAMAAQYVQAIRAVDPTGPYRLAGYSAGGLIALEMAQQLTRDGAQVALVAMIDTLCPEAARRRVSYLHKLWLMRHWSLQFALEWPGRRRKGKEADAHYAQALERVQRGEQLPPELVDFHLFRNFMAAQERYQLQPYRGPIVLFRATQGDMQYLAAGETLGWGDHVEGGIRVVRVPGSHLSMMSEPGVSRLIEGLRAELGLAAPAAAPMPGHNPRTA